MILVLQVALVIIIASACIYINKMLILQPQLARPCCPCAVCSPNSSGLSSLRA
jgi:hypothetical protein